MAQGAALADGYYTVPAGKLVNAVTWLEMRAQPAAPLAEPLRLVLVTESDLVECGRLFREVGTPYLWSRAAAVPAKPNDEIGPATHIARDDHDRPIGVVEFGREAGPGIEITYFGLTPDTTGRGLGRRMMEAALQRAWAEDPERVWLHTCNFDHPAALRFYEACGFKPYATGFEIMDDPRLNGSLPRSAAPHVPLIEL